jgi:hypothetical protein
LPDSPDDYGLPFHIPERTLPGHPGSKRRNPNVPLASPASKPFSSCESVRIDMSCPTPKVDPLLSSCPSRAFSVHTRGSQPAQTTRI